MTVLAVIEIGSTFTKLVAFATSGGEIEYVGRAAVRTSLDRGDVRFAVDELSRQAAGFGAETWHRAYLTSSAAGGLRIAVSGLTPTLSTKVGVEVALGAGGVVVASVAGRLRQPDLTAIEHARPGLVLVCGGTDDGESDVVLANVAALASSKLDTVFLYAGNQRIRQEASKLLEASDSKCVSVENVYPASDCFRYEQARESIRVIFEREVVKAPGVDALAASLGTGCMPTPLAVSRGVHLMGELLGTGLLAVDVGGATTDVHSFVAEAPGDVIRGSFEPELKRTVQGDLGVFVNLPNLVEPGEPEPPTRAPLLEAAALSKYTFRAAERAIRRHAGYLVRAVGPDRRRDVTYGADLRPIRNVLATGGALRAVARPGIDLAVMLPGQDRSRLLPEQVDAWLVDREYLMSSLGALSDDFGGEVRDFMTAGLKEGLWS